MTTANDERFLHGIPARFIMGLIGVVCLGFIVTHWNDEVMALTTSSSTDETVQASQASNGERVSEANPALAACLDERLGHVVQMKEDGVISEEQAASFSQRATSLCNVQNPS
ncbi:MAG: hypothetical protein ABJK39_15290 [Hyphomicrobiales bacterium]